MLANRLLATFVLAGCAAVPIHAQIDESNLQRATLVGLRAVPIDSLISGICTSIELDPNVRSLRRPTVFSPGPNVPIRFSVNFPVDSLKTQRPLTFREFDPDDMSGPRAKVIVGLFVPEHPSAADSLVLMVGVVGCRMWGSFARVLIWRRGPDFYARVRGISEG